MIPGLGTGLNTLTVLVGGTVGLSAGRLLSTGLQSTIRSALGLFTAVIGVGMALRSRNVLILLVSLILGALLGEVSRLDDGLQALGRWAERIANRGTDQQSSRVSVAFVTTSLLFCVGPLTILGTFKDGTEGDITLLAIKSALDGFAAIVFAATLGWGVLLSAGTVLVFQGVLTLLAFLIHAGLSDAQTAELTAVGGVAVLAIALGLLELKAIRAANLLPALVIAPALVGLLHAFRLI